jgi:hypothetical protein
MQEPFKDFEKQVLERHFEIVIFLTAVSAEMIVLAQFRLAIGTDSQALMLFFHGVLWF